jgi:hypothetical protein
MATPIPLFMSAEHVEMMNAVLDRSPDVRAACATLPRPLRMGYCLHDGPDGEPVHWTVSFADTISFSLDEQPCDVLFTGDWRTMMLASASAAQRQELVDTGLVASGDETLIEPLGAVLAAAQSAAVPATFPDL